MRGFSSKWWGAWLDCADPGLEVKSGEEIWLGVDLGGEEVPAPLPDENAAGWGVMRWLGGMSLGLVPVADAASFSWAGPWIGWVVPVAGAEHRAVVMFGVPSGVAWDPCGVTEGEGWLLEGGFVVSVLDVALARPHAMASASHRDPAELLDVDVHELARVTALIAVGGLRRIEPRALAEPNPLEPARHRGERQPE